MENQTAIIFTNYTDEDFVGYWNKVKYIVKAGQSIYFEDWKARHFAKHLADRELNKSNLPTNHPSRFEILKKILNEQDIVTAEDESKMESELLNTTPITKTKPTTIPANIPKDSSQHPDFGEESFEGLKEKSE